MSMADDANFDEFNKEKQEGYDLLKMLQEMALTRDQRASEMADEYSVSWGSLYTKLREGSFSEAQAFELVKIYVYATVAPNGGTYYGQ